MVKKEYLGRPEFWLDYCDNEADAEGVARMFPEYYRQYYASYLGHLGEIKGLAIDEAFAWARIMRNDVVKKLTSVAGGKHPFDKLSIIEGGSNADAYAKYIVKLAHQYLEQAKPKPTAVRARTPEGYTVVSGGRLATQELVENLSIMQAAVGDGLRWGPVLLPRKQARLSNFCVVGMPRSGKTTLLRLLPQSTQWRNRKCRLIIYDEKTGAPAAVFANEGELAEHGRLLNPFDKRSTAWDIAADAQSPHQANEIARTLIPEMGGRENPFFVAAARAVLAAAMVSLHATRGDNWNLMDLLLAVSSQHVDKILMKTAQGQEVLDTYFGDTNASHADLKKTLAAVLHPLMPVAAAWDRDSDKKVSIRRWAINGEGVLLLGNLTPSHRW